MENKVAINLAIMEIEEWYNTKIPNIDGSRRFQDMVLVVRKLLFACYILWAIDVNTKLCILHRILGIRKSIARFTSAILQPDSSNKISFPVSKA